ncbi:MAG: pyridoxal phosphate-dependent aminotransferase [Bacillota bacterium]|nr:pyridoxal phosphate-dependent aminotransferase [Bacillota bacterium]
MRELSNLAMTLKGSIIREMHTAAAGMTDILNFTVGEPDFVTPQPIIERAYKSMLEGKTFYSQNRGILALREAIHQHHKEVDGTNIEADPEDNILVTIGATEALQLALLATINPGDEVIVLTPCWPNYLGMIAVAGGVAVCVPGYEENGFAPNPEDIEAAITPKTKAIMINSPSNPTGAVLPKSTIDEIAGIIEKHDLFALVDEVYRTIVFDNQKAASLTKYPAIKDNIIFINSFSKTFAMTGWRIGYVIAVPELISKMTLLHQNFANSIFVPAQEACITALEECLPDSEKMTESYEKRRNIIVKGLNDIKGFSCVQPGGAFYAFTNISEFGMPSREFCLKVLKNTNAVTVPGVGFGKSTGRLNLDHFIRVSYATAEDKINEFLNRLNDFSQKFFASK